MNEWMNEYLIDLSPLGLFRARETKYWNKLNRLRIPTGWKQTTWLCTSAAKELNQGLPGTNPVIRAGLELRISRCEVWHPIKPLGHAASIRDNRTCSHCNHISCTPLIYTSVSLPCPAKYEQLDLISLFNTQHYRWGSETSNLPLTIRSLVLLRLQ